MFLDYVVLILFFVFVMVATHLIRDKIRGSNIKDIVRITTFFLPFLVPAIIFGFPNIEISSATGLFPYVVAIGSALVALAIQFKDYSSYLNKDVYELLPPITTMTFFAIVTSLIGSAIFEEIFYRSYIPSSVFFIECIVSGGLFCLSHYIQPLTRKTFTTRSYVILFLLSIAWYYSYKVSGTLLPAIIGHLIYNSSSIYIIFRRYVYSVKAARELALKRQERDKQSMYT